MDPTLKVGSASDSARWPLPVPPTASPTVVDRCEELGFDSLWVSERVGAPIPDPLVALAVAAGRTRRLKLGTSVLVLPGPQPGAAGQGDGQPRRAVGRTVPARRRSGHRRSARTAGLRGRARASGAAATTRPWPLMRQCWTGEVGLPPRRVLRRRRRAGPRPSRPRTRSTCGSAASPPASCVASGGSATAGCPRSAPPTTWPRRSRPSIGRPPTHGRAIDPQHFGALIAYCDGAIPDRFVSTSSSAAGPGSIPGPSSPTRAGLADRIREFVDAGASKFVVLPLLAGDDPADELGRLADELLPLQN